MNPRLKYFIAFLSTIALGIGSRKINGIPFIIGDILYAIMSYWMFRSLFTSKTRRLSLLLSILFCFSIEFLQLVQIQPLIWTRNNNLLKLILGQGFLWTDLIAYLTGSIITWLLDINIFKKKIINH